MIIFSLKEAILSLVRAKFASVITIITLTIASLFFTFSVISFVKSKTVEKELKNKIEIRLFLKEELNKTVMLQLRKKLESNKGISSVKFVSKKEAAAELKKSLGADFTEILGNNPLPASFILHVNPSLQKQQIDRLIANLNNEPAVDDVVYDKEEILFLLKVIFYVKIVIYVFALITILISLYLILTVNRLVIESRKKVYETMKLFGAKLSAIRMPIILNGIIMAFLSVILGTVVLFLAIYLLNKFLPYINFERLFLKLIVVYSIGAILMGILGGIFSARKINLKFDR